MTENVSPCWKERKSKLRRLKKREEELMARLDAIGAQKAAAEREMGLSENYSDGAKMKRLAEGIAELDAEAARLEDEWARTSEEVAGLE